MCCYKISLSAASVKHRAAIVRIKQSVPEPHHRPELTLIKLKESLLVATTCEQLLRHHAVHSAKRGKSDPVCQSIIHKADGFQYLQIFGESFRQHFATAETAFLKTHHRNLRPDYRLQIR